jgi:tetratricopeptide (TPR) repeat protein
MAVNYCGSCGLAVSDSLKVCEGCGAALVEQRIPDRENPPKLAASPTSAFATESGSILPLTSTRAPGTAPLTRPRATEPFVNQATKTVERVKAWTRQIPDQIGRKTLTRPAANNSRTVPPRVDTGGAASALAQASGIEQHPRSNRALYISLVVLTVLLGGLAFIIFQKQSMATFSGTRAEFNLVDPGEKSAALVKQGDEKYKAGDFPAALAQFQQAVKFEPRNAQALAGLAQSSAALGQNNEALSASEKALEIDDKNLVALLVRADVYRTRGSWREAYQDYQKILAIDQNSDQAAEAVTAIERYVLAVRDAERNANAPRVKGSKPGHEKSLPEASSPEDVPLSQPNTVPGARISVPGLPEFDLKNQAREIGEQLKKKGIDLQKGNKYGESVATLERALALLPDDKDIFYHLGTSYSFLKQPEKALENYLKCTSGPYAPVAQKAAIKAQKAYNDEQRKRLKG